MQRAGCGHQPDRAARPSEGVVWEGLHKSIIGCPESAALVPALGPSVGTRTTVVPHHTPLQNDPEEEKRLEEERRKADAESARVARLEAKARRWASSTDTRCVRLQQNAGAARACFSSTIFERRRVSED